MTAPVTGQPATNGRARAARYRPTRAGVINLWDYRDEEFVFADGRLVLRGPNGSGKTKALEVLFPFVLDGWIEPRRLNPFASEDRTMRSNLLYRGQQASYGYVWMEFGSSSGAVSGAVTVGIGMQASRHSEKVKRWYFVVEGRVGVDFSLLTADERPLTRKQLITEIGADAVRDNPGEHRAAVDARLFRLGRERYEQLITLVLTLRRPQLAKNLDPIKLSDTLSDGLRPLDDHLLTEAARSFDDMEAVARTLEGLVRADEAATSFLTAYTTYLRSHARIAADALTGRRGAVGDRCDELAAAVVRRRDAQHDRDSAAQRLHDTELAITRWRGQLNQLRSSAAYGPTLAKALVPEQTELVDPARVAAVLSSVALLAADAVPAPGDPPTVSPGGRFNKGVQLGAFTKTAAEFIGATARARRRAARLAELDGLIADASARLDDTDRLATRARAVLDAADAAAAELPRLGAIVEALRRHDRAAGVLRATRERLDEARSALDQAVAEVGARDRLLRRVAADRALPPEVVDDVAAAVVRFGQTAARLSGVRREAGAARDRVEDETGRVEQAHDEEEQATQDAKRAELRCTEESQRYEVLHQTVGAEAEEMLARVAATETAIDTAESERSAATATKEQAAAACARAETWVDAATEMLRTALVEEQAEAKRLAPFVNPDVLTLLRCSPELR